MSLKEQLKNDMKSAMRGREKNRLAVIRMLNAAIKQREIDDSTTLDDAGVLAVIEKMVKQRRDAAAQYRDADRMELAEAEEAEIAVLDDYLPEQLSDEAIDGAIDSAIADNNAESMRDMGKVMGALKRQLQGQADMAVVSQRLKAKLQ